MLMHPRTTAAIVALLLFVSACQGTTTPESVSLEMPEPVTYTSTPTRLPPSATPTPPSPTPPSAQVVAAATPPVVDSRQPALATDTPEAASTATPTDTPSPEPSPTPTLEPDWLSSVGRTPENWVYLGNPDAPVTLIDFSDFL